MTGHAEHSGHTGLESFLGQETGLRQGLDSRQLLTRAAVVLAMLAATAVFVYRGPMRAMYLSSDMAVIYAPARLWVLGQNPYDPQAMVDTLKAQGYVWRHDENPRRFAALYPPTIYAVLAPLGLMPWAWARATWLAVNVAAVFLLWWGVVRLSGWRPFGRGGLLMLAVTLAWAPVHTNIALGQVALVSSCAAVWGLQRSRRRRGLSGGALIGLGTAIKPQVAGLFVLGPLCRGKLRAPAAMVGVVAAFTALAVIRLEAAGQPWWSEWRRNLAFFVAQGLGDASASSELRHRIVSLHVLAHAVTDDAKTAAVLVWIAAAALSGWTAWLVFGRRKVDDLFIAACVALVTMLAVYHRFYDAVLLLAPMAWAVRQWVRGPRWPGVVAAMLLATLFLPMSAVIDESVERGWLPVVFQQSLWARWLLLVYEPWVTLLAWVTMLVAATMGSVTVVHDELPKADAAQDRP